jgi:transglutaminase-like putative cysteine protease
MRLSIHHTTTYRYEASADYAAQVLRLTPREYRGLDVVHWNVWTTGPGRLANFEDGFGNLSHVHTVVDVHDSLCVHVETADTQGIVAGGMEPLPLGVFLRTTPLTFPSAAIADLAAVAARAGAPTAVLRRLMELVTESVEYRKGSTNVTTTAAQALDGRSGVCQDQAHVFIAAARVLGIPARYVGGYLCVDGLDSEGRLSHSDLVLDQAGHAWAEAYDADLGWTGFDAANGVLPGVWHVRTSVGLDYESAAPVRGVRRGHGTEALEVGVQVSRLGEQ